MKVLKNRPQNLVVLYGQILILISWEEDEKLTKHVLAIWRQGWKDNGNTQLESDYNGLDESLPSGKVMYQEMDKSSGH